MLVHLLFVSVPFGDALGDTSLRAARQQSRERDLLFGGDAELFLIVGEGVEGLTHHTLRSNSNGDAPKEVKVSYLELGGFRGRLILDVRHPHCSLC